MVCFSVLSVCCFKNNVGIGMAERWWRQDSPALVSGVLRSESHLAPGVRAAPLLARLLEWPLLLHAHVQEPPTPCVKLGRGAACSRWNVRVGEQETGRRPHGAAQGPQKEGTPNGGGGQHQPPPPVHSCSSNWQCLMKPLPLPAKVLTGLRLSVWSLEERTFCRL